MGVHVGLTTPLITHNIWVPKQNTAKPWMKNKNKLQELRLETWPTMYASGSMTTIVSAQQRYLCKISSYIRNQTDERRELTKYM